MRDRASGLRREGPRGALYGVRRCLLRRVPFALWIGSRGLAGKTYLLGLLIATELATLGTGVSLFGGSREQAVIAFDYARRFWERDTGGALPTASWRRRGREPRQPESAREVGEVGARAARPSTWWSPRADAPYLLARLQGPVE